MNRKHVLGLCGLIIAAMFTGCSAPKMVNQTQLQNFQAQADLAVEQFVQEYPELQTNFDNAAGYAIFPTVGHGAWGLGLAFGEGLVYEGKDVIGTAGHSMYTIGFQFGGQAFRKVVFFNTQAALDNFTSNGGNFDLALQTSAVFGPWGVSADAANRNQVEIYTVQQGGLIYEASIGGQNFDYRPLD